MPKIHNLTFNSVSARSKGIFITGAGTFNAAELDATSYTIPGRNGDLIISNNRYKNITVVYPAFIPSGFSGKVQEIRDWMRSATTYKVLQDTYDEDHFRLGIPVGILEFEPVNQNDAANFQLIFNCKPQRFLVSGEEAQGFDANGSITNPTQYTALPLIRIRISDYGEGTVTIGDTTMSIGSTTGDIYVDCETQNCYQGAANKNNEVSFSNGFPKLEPGTTPVFIGGDVFKVDITPRWWEL